MERSVRSQVMSQVSVARDLAFFLIIRDCVIEEKFLINSVSGHETYL